MPTQRIAVRIPRNQTDPDAQAFITAAGITDTTQKSAINTLVVNLKAYGIWTKMKAIYPFVGSTASQHKWNLKDPRDLDVAFRLRFFGGTIHTANGVQGNALNAYYNTYLNANSLPISSNAAGVYIRTNVAESGVDFGAINANAYDSAQFGSRNTSNQYVSRWYQANNGLNTTSNTDSRGFYQLTRRNSSEYITAKNTSKLVVLAPASSVIPSMPFYGLAAYFKPTAADAFHSSKQIAFHYFADSSLSNTELDNLYTAVQAFQTTLGRSIGTQTVSDADAQAFIDAAQITDQVQATAINNLVIGLKADSIWTKMKALYPMVGGTSASHYINLKTPGTYNLSFSTGWIHSSTGARPNGAAYADTLFNPSTLSQSLTSTHLSYYQRGNSDAGTSRAKMGAATNDTLSNSVGLGFFSSGTREVGIIGATGGAEYAPSGASAAAQGLFMINTNGNRNARHWKNGVANGAAVTQSGAMPNFNIYLAALNNNNFINASYFHNKECAFASIGDGLTDTEAANFYTRVQAFQTTLNRQV